VDINIAWETIGEFIKISAKEDLYYYKLKKHRSWFDEGCPELLNQRKEAKLQWLQYQNKINGNDVNYTNNETSENFGNEKKECLNNKTNDLATHKEKEKTIII
jgi:hypothetical protein